MKKKDRERDYHFPSKLDLHVHEVQDREQNVALSDCTSYFKDAIITNVICKSSFPDHLRNIFMSLMVDKMCLQIKYFLQKSSQ